MPRPAPERLEHASQVDLAPVIAPDLSDLLVSLERLVRWADSPSSRWTLMHAVDFPVDDVAVFLVVNQLVYCGAMRPTELADALGMGRPNISRLSARAADLGLVVKIADPNDDRGVLIALSEEGRRIGDAIIAFLRRGLVELLSAWPEGDVAAFRELVGRYVSDVERAYPAR